MKLRKNFHLLFLFLLLTLSIFTNCKVYSAQEEGRIAHGVYVIGSTAYLSLGIDGMQILDVSVKEEPEKLASYEDSSFGFYDLVIEGDYAYINEGRSFSIINIEDNNPTFEKRRIFEANLDNFDLMDDLAFLVTNPDGLMLFDISNPSTFTLVSSFYSLLFQDISVDDNYVYATTSNGLEVYERISLTNLTNVGYFNHTFNYESELIVEENYAYISSNRDFLICDISNKTSPSNVSTFQSSYSNNDFTLSENYSYLVNPYYYFRETGAIEIYDLKEKTNPENIAVYYTIDKPTNVFVLDNYLYIAEKGGLEIVDITNPQNPLKIGYYSLKTGLEKAIPIIFGIAIPLMILGIGFLIYRLREPILKVFRFLYKRH